MIGEGGAAGVRSGLAVEEYRQTEPGERVPGALRGVNRLGHPVLFQRHERHDVQRPEERMNASVSGNVDVLDRRGGKGLDCPHQLVGFAQQGQHGPVVVGVGRHVEHPHAGRRPGLRAGVDDVRAQAFADVGHALQADHGVRLAMAGALVRPALTDVASGSTLTG